MNKERKRGRRREQRFALKTADNHLIHGVLSYQGRKPQRLIVFVHGLVSYSEEAKYYNGARAFEAAGFAVVRFALYGERLRSRKLRETGLSDHAADLMQVVAHFKEAGFKEIFLVGHSLGCPTILGTGISGSGISDVKGLVFWDGTAETWLHKKAQKWGASYQQCLQGYIIDWGVEFLWGTKMYQESQAFPPYQQLLKKLALPALLLLAGKGVLVKHWRLFEKKYPGLLEMRLIKGAGHNFEELDTLSELLRQSVLWCQKQSDL